MIIVKSNIIPFRGYIAITLWPFIIVRRSALSKFTDSVLRHELIHGRQQVEMLLLGAVMSVWFAAVGAGWWSVLLLPIFYWCYGMEWLLGLLCFGNSDQAYDHISFEREAADNEKNVDYLRIRKPFAWIKYIVS